MPPIQSAADLVAVVAPILQRTLADQRESILSTVHPAVARWEAGVVFDAIGPKIPGLLTDALSSLAAECRTMTVAELVAAISRVLPTS